MPAAPSPSSRAGIKEVERELAALQLQLRMNVGPKKHALEMLRRKIEAQNERVRAAALRRDATKRVRAGRQRQGGSSGAGQRSLVPRQQERGRVG